MEVFYGATAADIVSQRFLSCDLPHRYGGLKQRMIRELFENLDEGLVSRDCRAIRVKIKNDPKIQKWLQEIVTLST